MKIATNSATVTIDSSSKQIWLKVEQSYTAQTTRTRLTPHQVIQLAHALLEHALKAEEFTP